MENAKNKSLLDLNDESFMELKNKSILNLNDDCLMEIFKYLSLMDIFHIIDIQQPRLTEIAYKRIASFRNLNIDIREFPNFTWKQLKIIGKHLHSLNMSVGYSIPIQTVLNIIQPLCEGAAVSNQLKELTLNYVFFNKRLCEYIGSAACNLNKVDLSYCQLTDELLSEFLKNCTNLIELKIFGNYTLSGHFLQNLCMPNLRILKLEMHAEWNFPIEEFIMKNPNIKLIMI